MVPGEGGHPPPTSLLCRPATKGEIKSVEGKARGPGILRAGFSFLKIIWCVLSLQGDSWEQFFANEFKENSLKQLDLHLGCLARK